MSQILVIQPLSPLPGETVTIKEGSALTVKVQITLGCGCPTSAGGRWDASRFRVNGHIRSLGGSTILDDFSDSSDLNLAYSGRASEFSADIPILSSGRYCLEIESLDPETGVAGRCKIEFCVRV